MMDHPVEVGRKVDDGGQEVLAAERVLEVLHGKLVSQMVGSVRHDLINLDQNRRRVRLTGYRMLFGVALYDFIGSFERS